MNRIASDSNDGSQARPLKTVSKATAIAVANNGLGLGTKIFISPATYRESVTCGCTGQETSAPIVLEATTPGQAIVSASDIWTGWIANPATGTSTHSWPYAWGLSPYPAGWAGAVNLPDSTRRQEMIFVNGVPMTEVLTASALKPGTFYVSENQGVVSMMPQTGIDLSSAVVEVSTRSVLLSLQCKNNFVIRGLVFQHETSPIQQNGGILITNSSNILIDNCIIRWNNYAGIRLAAVDHATIRNTTSQYNGWVGVEGWGITNTLWDGNVSSYNNWRGASSGFFGWASAGMKLSSLRDCVIQNQQSYGNQADGLWLDTDNQRVSITNLSSHNNLANGLFFEANQGPITVNNSSLAYNNQAAILFGDTRNVSISNVALLGNTSTQIQISGSTGGRIVTDYQTGVASIVSDSNIALNSTKIEATAAKQTLISTTLAEADWRHFYTTSQFSYNTWYNSWSTNVFDGLLGIPMTLQQWQAQTGLDLTSSFTNPAL